jgi:hypothetical protein
MDLEDSKYRYLLLFSTTISSTSDCCNPINYRATDNGYMRGRIWIFSIAKFEENCIHSVGKDGAAIGNKPTRTAGLSGRTRR